MNALTPAPANRRSIVHDMAHRYGMEPDAFEATLRKTCVPENATREEFAAFLVVARNYELNPILREIYAFPKKGGGIQPIVGVDGWATLINRQTAFDGMTFEDRFDQNGTLVSVTCRMYRKDRSHETEATEYMEECIQYDAKGAIKDTWAKWPRRMLRHKSMIQAARYAFGFAGIVDPDEAERFTVSGGGLDQPSLSAPPPPPAEESETLPAHGHSPSSAPLPPQDTVETAAFTEAPVDYEAQFAEIANEMAVAQSIDNLDEIMTDGRVDAMPMASRERLENVYDKQAKRLMDAQTAKKPKEAKKREPKATTPETPKESAQDAPRALDEADTGDPTDSLESEEGLDGTEPAFNDPFQPGPADVASVEGYRQWLMVMEQSVRNKEDATRVVDAWRATKANRDQIDMSGEIRRELMNRVQAIATKYGVRS